MAMKYVRTTWTMSFMVMAVLVFAPVVVRGEDEVPTMQGQDATLSVEYSAMYGDAYADDGHDWDGYYDEVYACEEAHALDGMSGVYRCADTAEPEPHWLDQYVKKLREQVVEIGLRWSWALRGPLVHLVENVSPTSLAVVLHQLAQPEPSMDTGCPSAEVFAECSYEDLIEEPDIDQLFRQGISAEEALRDARQGIVEISSGTGSSGGCFPLWKLSR